MVLTLERLGIACEYHHHEVATAGQCEIDMRFSTLTRMADQLMTYKYVVRNAAKRAGKTATFMPKPIFGDNGSGMHCHQSLWKDGKTLMADDSGYAGLSDLARGYVGGLLKHAPALLAFAAPTTNSYRRLVPGYEAPVNLVYSQRNRSACIRIPVYSSSPKAKRIEFRCPDPLGEPVPRLPGRCLDSPDSTGSQKASGPRAQPADTTSSGPAHQPLRRPDIPQVPGSLAEALDALEADHEFLLRRRRLHRGPDPHLDRLEARERGRPGPAPPASARVLALLRRLATLRAMRYVFADCRWSLDDPDWGREQYLAGHIPGAAFLDVERDLSGPAGQKGRHPLPSAGGLRAGCGGRRNRARRLRRRVRHARRR